SRDVPLPYTVCVTAASLTPETPATATAELKPTAPDIEAQTTASMLPSLRLRKKPTPESPGPARGILRVGEAMAAAHAQDFVRRKKGEGAEQEGANNGADGSNDEEDEEPFMEREYDEEWERAPSTSLTGGRKAWGLGIGRGSGVVGQGGSVGESSGVNERRRW